MSYWRGCVGGWGLGRAALFEGGGLSPVGQLWVVGHPTHDERTEKVSLEHKLQGGMGKTIYFSYANGASDLKLYLPSKKNIDSTVFWCLPTNMKCLPKKISSNYGFYTVEQWKNWTSIYSLHTLEGVIIFSVGYSLRLMN